MANIKKENLKYGNAKKIIGIVSGKGGVGKSTVTASLGVKLAEKGYKVGILDGDIVGPSIPRIFGKQAMRGNVERIDDEVLKFDPVISKTGIKLASFNFYTRNEDDAVMWRGPIISSTLTQIFTEVNWEELDYLLIDMPPGTTDTAITVMQNYGIDGIVAVGTPQKMVTMIVKKLINMANRMNVPVFGVVENMSYLTSSTGEKLNIWGKESAGWHAMEMGQVLLADLPMDHDMSEYMDRGDFEGYIKERPEFETMVENFINLIGKID